MILAIESSCDEFSIALVQHSKDKVDCLMMKTISQINSHATFGGVVPELASREHVKLFTKTLEAIKDHLKHDYTQIDAIAVTIGPGLSGSLLIGIQVAKVVATLLNKPLIPMHHILGHLFSGSLTAPMEFPCLGLVVSGGHTEIIYCLNTAQYEIIGCTRDDAVGEVYDKIAKKLGLPYPGGPLIDTLAQKGNNVYTFTKPKLTDQFAFSFSGVKSAVINLINRKQQLGDEIDIEDISCSFQAFVVDELLIKLAKALEMYPSKTVVLCGGVSANSELRKNFQNMQQKFTDRKFIVPDIKYCSDNAAMIGAAALFNLMIKPLDHLKVDCRPNLTVEEYVTAYKNNEVK